MVVKSPVQQLIALNSMEIKLQNGDSPRNEQYVLQHHQNATTIKSCLVVSLEHPWLAAASPDGLLYDPLADPPNGIVD